MRSTRTRVYSSSVSSTSFAHRGIRPDRARNRRWLFVLTAHGAAAAHRRSWHVGERIVFGAWTGAWPPVRGVCPRSKRAALHGLFSARRRSWRLARNTGRSSSPWRSPCWAARCRPASGGAGRRRDRASRRVCSPGAPCPLRGARLEHATRWRPFGMTRSVEVRCRCRSTGSAAAMAAPPRCRSSARAAPGRATCALSIGSRSLTRASAWRARSPPAACPRPRGSGLAASSCLPADGAAPAIAAGILLKYSSSQAWRTV